jgi:ketol-acid reductoisomerase
MRQRISDTAEWGDYVSGPRVIGEASKKAMADILAEIRSGAFARRWIAECAGDSPEFNRLRSEGSGQRIESVGRRLRSRMAWLQDAEEGS